MPTNIPYQPIQFNLPDYLTKPEIFRQLIHEDDKLNFQVKADISETNLITPGLANYTQDPSSQWVTLGGRLSKVMGNEGRIYQSILTVGDYYRVDISIFSLNINGQVEVYLGSNLLEILTTEGNHTLWGQVTDNDEFSIYADSSTSVIVENTVSVYEVMNNIRVIAVGEEEEDYQSLASSANFVKRDIAVFQDLSLPDFDCFSLWIGINDNDIVWSENFNSPPVGWFLNNLQFISNRLQGTDIPIFASAGAEKDIELPQGTFIDFSMTVLGLVNMNYNLAIYYNTGTTYQFVYSSGTITTPGPFLRTIKLPSRPTNNFRVVLTVFPQDDDNLIIIDDMIAYSALGDYMVSNPFKKISNTEGTLLLEASNDSDCFGFIFDEDFQFNLRFKGDLQMFLPEDEAEVYKDSRGVKKLYYAESEETQQIAFDAAPIYIVRAIQKMRLLNNLLLDGVEKVIFDDDFDLDVDSEKMNTGAFLVTDKEQNYFNYL